MSLTERRDVLEKDGHILQHIMIEQDKAFFILPGVVNTPPPVFPAANEQVLGPFPATAEDLKI